MTQKYKIEDYPKELMDRLGKVPDKVLADEYDMSKVGIYSIRKKFGKVLLMYKLKLSNKILCVYGNKCSNYNNMCSKCKWNGNNQFGNHLALKDSDGRTIKYLEKDMNGSC